MGGDHQGTFDLFWLEHGPQARCVLASHCMSDAPFLTILRRRSARGTARHLALGVLDDRTSRAARGLPDPARHPRTPLLPRTNLRGLTAAARTRLLRGHPPRRRLAREPQPGAVLLWAAVESNIGDLNQELNEFFGSMISMDDPKHFRLRSIVSKGFTPRHISGRRGAGQAGRRRPRRPDDRRTPRSHRRLRRGTFAGPLPLEIICSMMGIPPTDTAQIFDWTNTILGVGDPEFGGVVRRAARRWRWRSSPTRRRSARSDGPTPPTTSPRR